MALTLDQARISPSLPTEASACRHRRGDWSVDQTKRFWSYASSCVGGEHWVPAERFAYLKHDANKRVRELRQTDSNYRERQNAIRRRPESRARQNYLAMARYWGDPEYKRSKIQSALRWASSYPEKRATRENRRRARKEGAVPKNQTPEDSAIIASIYSQAQRVSKCLGVTMHVDHILPLSKGGVHQPSNLQVLPKTTNLRKSDKLDFQLQFAF
jgi:5-methylcytosine-specific restriction endonuclease McrA